MDILLGSKETMDFINNSMHISGEIKYLNRITTKGMHVIDVGGNYGLVALHISRLIGQEGQIFIFEPIKEFYDKIIANFAANNINNATYIQSALGNTHTELDMYLDGPATTISLKDDKDIIKIPFITLDSYCAAHKLERIDLLNMDCEGSELIVLQGANGILQKNNVKVFCEIHHQFLKLLNQSVYDIVEYLKGLNYKVFSLALTTTQELSEEFDECEYIYAFKE